MSVALSVSNLVDVNREVKKWFDAVEDAARDAVVGLAKEVLDNALINSPQYSGDYTASWRVTFNHIDSTYEKDAISGAARWNQGAGGPEPFGRGDQKAIDFALTHNAAVWPTIKLGGTVYITNSAQHEDAYAWKIENNEITFRTPNMGAYRVGQNAVEKIARRHPTITKAQLKSWKVLGT